MPLYCLEGIGNRWGEGRWVRECVTKTIWELFYNSNNNTVEILLLLEQGLVINQKAPVVRDGQLGVSNR